MRLGRLTRFKAKLAAKTNRKNIYAKINKQINISVDTNQGTNSKSGGLESVKYYVFNGEDEDKWNEYCIKTLAFAETKGWVEGLTNENASEDMKKKVKSYLTMSLTGKVFKFLDRSREPKDVRDALEEELSQTEDEDRYELEEEFKQCKMVDQYGNPTDWFNQLDEINTKIGNIKGGKYTKTEDDIKLQIRMNLLENVYSEVITLFKNYSTMTLKEV